MSRYILCEEGEDRKGAISSPSISQLNYLSGSRQTLRKH